MSVAIDDTETSRRRRAVFQALAPFLPRDRLIAALWLWEEAYGRGAAFALNEFLQRVCDTPQLRALRNTLYLSLVKYMTRPLAQLGPDPWPLMRGARSGPAAPSAGRLTPPARVFSELLGRFLETLELLNAESQVKIRAALLDRLPRLGVTGAAGDDFIRWLTQHEAAIVHLPELGDLRRVLHHAYVLACEYYGPVPSDRALAAAVKFAEALPEAAQFPPRQFL